MRRMPFRAAGPGGNEAGGSPREKVSPGCVHNIADDKDMKVKAAVIHKAHLREGKLVAAENVVHDERIMEALDGWDKGLVEAEVATDLGQKGPE